MSDYQDDPKTGLPPKVTAGPWWTDGRYDSAEMACPIIAARTDCGPLPGNPTRGMVAATTAGLHTDARRTEANAILIAAAPEMYRALVGAEEALARRGELEEPTLQRVRAALHKARQAG